MKHVIRRIMVFVSILKEIKWEIKISNDDFDIDLIFDTLLLPFMYYFSRVMDKRKINVAFINLLLKVHWASVSFIVCLAKHMARWNDIYKLTATRFYIYI